MKTIASTFEILLMTGLAPWCTSGHCYPRNSAKKMAETTREDRPEMDKAIMACTPFIGGDYSSIDVFFEPTHHEIPSHCILCPIRCERIGHARNTGEELGRLDGAQQTSHLRAICRALKCFFGEVN